MCTAIVCLLSLYTIVSAARATATTAWSRKYVEVDGFVEKRPLAGSSGEKTRSCDFGRYFIHCIATNSSFLTCSAMFLRLPVVKGGY